MRKTKQKKNTEEYERTLRKEGSAAEVMEKNGRKGAGKKKKGTVLIVIGVVLILSSLSLTGYNLWDNERAGKASEEIIESLDRATADLEPSDAPAAVDQNDSDVVFGGDDAGSGAGSGASSPDSMDVLNINGYEYIGTIEIPRLGIRLPVMSEWDYSRLKVSPCRYTGSYLTNDMVICGHNYAKHFSPIKRIGIGEDVYFTTVDKVVYHYTVCNRETVQPTDVKVMVENLKNAKENNKAENWDLTLFTCNPGGQTRCAVRCIRADS